MELFGAVVGIIYLILEYRVNPWLYLFGILMGAVYSVVFFQEGIYANACINVYYVLISIYGALCWRRYGSSDNGNPTTRSMPRRLAPWLLAFLLALTLFLTWLLSALGESDVAFLDGVTSALSIISMWMMAKKYYQQWIGWIIVEPVMVILSLRSGLYYTAVMYVVYSVIAVMGYLRWKKLYGPSKLEKK